MTEGQGEHQVMDADLIVARLIFEVLTSQRFTLEGDRGEIERVAEEFVNTWTGHDDDRSEVAGVLRASLNDQPVRYRGYDPDRLLVIWVGVSYRLIKESQLQTDAIRDLVLNAERVARERGVRLAPANRLGSLGSDPT